jgi:Protein of unknown function (DUF2510)
MRNVAKTLMLAGAIVYVIALATLHYWTAGSTWWSQETVGPAVATGIAVAVAAFAFAGIFSDSIAVVGLAIALSFLLLGDTVYTGENGYSFFGAGYWVTSACALIMAVGGVFAFSGYALRDPRIRQIATASALPPAGWFEDPSGEARERYWTGGAWSEHTR